jgi:septum site-determining protein MinD
MTKFIVIASGKGGVGKTTCALNIGIALVEFGRDVIVVDANVSKPNIGIHLGKSIVNSSLSDVLKGDKTIREVVHLHSSGLKIIPTSISNEDMRNIKIENLSQSIRGLEGVTEIVIIDAGPGINPEVMETIKSADEMIVVVTPDLLSVTDALKTIKIAKRMDIKIIGVIVNRVEEHHSELSSKNIEQMLEEKVIGIVHEDKAVKESLRLRHPVTYSHPESSSSIRFKRIAAYLIGEKYKYPVQKETRLGKFLRKTGIKE